MRSRTTQSAAPRAPAVSEKQSVVPTYTNQRVRGKAKSRPGRAGACRPFQWDTEWEAENATMMRGCVQNNFRNPAERIPGKPIVPIDRATFLWLAGEVANPWRFAVFDFPSYVCEWGCAIRPFARRRSVSSHAVPYGVDTRDAHLGSGLRTRDQGRIWEWPGSENKRETEPPVITTPCLSWASALTSCALDS